MHHIEPPTILLMRLALAPLVVIVTFTACVVATGIKVDDAYLLLALLGATLSAQLLNNIHLRATIGRGFVARAGEVFSRWLLIVAVMVFAVYLANISDSFSRLAILSWFVLCPFVFLLAEAVFSRFLFYLTGKKELRCAVVIGAGKVGARLIHELTAEPGLGIRCMGFFDDRGPERREKVGTPLLGKLQDVAEFCKVRPVNTIFIALPMSSGTRMQQLLSDLRDTTASIYFVSDLLVFDFIPARTASFRGLHFIGICESPFVGINGVIKRMSDIVLGILATLVAMPLMALIACGIKRSSDGPIIFKQRRYGLDGKEILVYKFRTMHEMEDGARIPQAQPNDRRTFPFGALLRRTSLDELPQLFNVIQGSMSLVGPRPHAVAHNELYRTQIPGYMIRHKVKPGMTGWAQIHGLRGATDTVDKMQQRIDRDVYYLRNWSLTLDFIILVKTIPLVFSDTEAY